MGGSRRSSLLALTVVGALAAPAAAATRGDGSIAMEPVLPTRVARMLPSELPPGEGGAGTRTLPHMPVPGDLPMPEGWQAPPALDPGLAPSDPDPAPQAPGVGSSFQALDDDNSAIPPDTHGAAGPSHLMTTLNTQVRIQDRNGTVLYTTSLVSWWSPLAVFSPFDPKILYDPFGNRWIMVSVAEPVSSASSLLVATSASSDAMGGWTLYRYDADPSNTTWADYPSLGFNKNWIGVGVNMFTGSGSFSASKVFALRKQAHYDGTGVGAVATLGSTSCGGSTCGNTHVPAITHDGALSRLWILNHWSSSAGTLRMFYVDGSVGSEEFFYTNTFPSYGSSWDFSPSGGADFAPQAGTSARIQANDSRLQNLVYRNGSLWATQTVFLPAGGPARAAAQWWQVTTAGAVSQRGRVEDASNSFFYAFPSISVNANNDALLGYSRFSAGTYASAGFSFRYGTDAANTMQSPTVFKAGLASYYKVGSSGRNRWGDYSAAMVDPVNDVDFWTIQEYASTPSGGYDRWGTWWARVLPAGVPTPAAGVSPSSLAFGDVIIGQQSNPQTVTVTSTGTANLVVGTVTLDGTNPGDFVLSSNNCNGASLAPGQSCQVGVRFAPTVAGGRSATVTIPHNAAGSPSTIPVSGNGVQPVVAISTSPSSVSFGTVFVGQQSGPQTITVSSTGNQTATIGTVTLGGIDPGDFQITSNTCSGASLAPGQSCQVGVRFAPTAEGSRNGTVVIPSNAPSSPATVPLSGSGVVAAPILTADPSSLSFGNAGIGQASASQTVSVSNTGNANLVVSTVTLGGTDPAEFMLTGETCTAGPVAPGGSCQISAAFAPTSAGDKAAAIQIASNAAGSPAAVPLAGTGVTDAGPPTSSWETPNNAILVWPIGRVRGTVTDDASGVLSLEVTYTPLVGFGAPLSFGAELTCDIPTSCTFVAGTPLLPGRYLAQASGTDAFGQVEVDGPTVIVNVV